MISNATERVHTYFNANDDLRDIERCLEKSADSFYRVGNIHISEELMSYAKRINLNLTDIDTYTTQELTDRVQQGFDTSYQLLASTLAGIKIGQEKTND